MENIQDEKQLVKYSRHYSNEKLKDKLLRVAKKAGIKVVYAVYLLYYTLLDDRFPTKDKMVILGALGYFIFPFDFILDAIPFLGYTDDLLALIFVVRKVYTHVTPEIKEKSKQQVKNLFGEVDESEFELF
ncbi:MAG: DUF1232 domain-containing protein [Tannerellaceae bacterium]|jgi:uncharacterized membrane protein YkvA (DUF1232 family)|nr:DUF1232 domain-containing protein [Tannerellaceae bacterium]